MAAMPAITMRPTRNRRRAGSWKCVSGAASRRADRKATSGTSSASARSPPRSSRACSPAYVPCVCRISRYGQSSRVLVSASVISSAARPIRAVARRRAAVRPSRYDASQASFNLAGGPRYGPPDGRHAPAWPCRASRTHYPLSAKGATHGELGEPKVGVEEAGEAFTGGGDRLRLLGDRVERERAVQRQVRVGEPQRADGEPRPGQTEREDETEEIRDGEPRERQRAHGGLEPRAAERRVRREVPRFLRGEAEP